MEYASLSAAEQLLVDIVNGDEPQAHQLGDARFGNSLQQRGLVRVTYPPGEPKRVVIEPTQRGRNWVVAIGLMEPPAVAARV